MKVSRKDVRRIAAEALQSAASELDALGEALRRAYALFNRTDDPALLEASILEIGALQSRYGSVLRNIKTLNGEMEHGLTRHRTSGNSRSGGNPAACTAAPNFPKTDQVGV